MPTVSVIMPVHNGVEFIAEAIGSVFAQTFTDWELIVVDDGSTDETAQILSNLGARVNLLWQPNRGPSAARNKGLGAAQGEYVAFLDADDEWDVAFLQTAVNTLSGLDAAALGVCTGWAYINRRGLQLPHTQTLLSGFLNIQDFLTRNLCPMIAVLVRRERLIEVNGFDAQLLAMEDWDLWLRLMLSGCRFYAIPNCLAYYRLHGPSQSRRPDNMRYGRLQALQKLFEAPLLPADVRPLREWAMGRALIQSSSEWYQAGHGSEAAQDFAAAIQRFPRLLQEDETYYAVICAEQPIGYKGTAHRLDLPTSERRMGAVLAGVLNSISSVAHWRRIAYGRMYATLAQLAYGQCNMSLTRQYLWRAFLSDVTQTFHKRWLRTTAKSLLGSRSVDSARRRLHMRP